MTGNRVSRTVALCLLLVSVIVNARSQQPAEYVENQVIIKLQGGITQEDIDNIRGSLGATISRRFPVIGAELWDISGVTVDGAVAQYSGDGRIVYIEPNYIVHADAIYPNDPDFDELWGLHNTGQMGGTPDADIDAPLAWAVGTGDSVVVGVIDTGVDYTHPDLAANIWSNPGEIPGNGIDDDGNGFVDDVHGWDFVRNDNDPMDDNGHGTHVSGTIAAVGNNGVGVVGVNWSARIMGIKFLGAGGSGTTADAISSVEYATLAGAQLTNNSWGGGGFSQALKDAIAASGSAGMLFVAAAGNSGSNNDLYPHYPSSYDCENIISVANTDHNDNISPGSCYGLVSVDLGAPGTNIYSTVPGGGYGYKSGTSMATPHVAGAVALFWSLYPGTPHMNVKERILASVDPVPALAGITATGGRLNAFMGVAEPDSIPPGPVTDLAAGDPTSNSIELSWTASGDDGSSGEAAYYDIRYATFPIDGGNFHLADPAPGLLLPQPAGSPENFVVEGLDFSETYYFALKVFDEWGNASTVSNSPSETTLGPPRIAIAPPSMSDSLITGAVSVHTLIIGNTGEGTLDFGFPLFEALRLLGDATIPKNDVSNEFPDIEVGKGEEDSREGAPVVLGAGGPDGFGYLWIDSDEPGGPVFDWMDISSVGTRIFLGDDDYEDATLPFAFPFYGEDKTQVKISSNGYLTFGAYGTDLTNDPIPNTNAPDDFIAAFWDDLYPPGGSVYIHHDTARNWFIIEFKEVPRFASGGPYTFEYILKPTGAILIQYLSMGSYLNSATTGLENKDGTDGLQVAFNTEYAHDNLAVSFQFTPEWVSVHPAEGRVWAGDSTSVDVTFDAAGLHGGMYTDSLFIESNDPVEPTVAVPLLLEVTGASDIAVSDTMLAFGEVFVGRERSDTLVLMNMGTELLHVTDITIDHPYFHADTSAFDLGIGEVHELVVTFAPPDTGLALGALLVSTNDPDEPVVTVELGGLGLYPPEIVVYPDSLVEELQWGETRESMITICNEGRSDLDFWISIAGAEAAGLQVDFFAGEGSGNAPVVSGTPVPLERLEELRVSIPARAVLRSDGDSDSGAPAVANPAPGAPLGRIQGEEVFGSDEYQFYGGPRSRGNLFTCTSSTNLVEHRLYINPTASTQMWFLVYEGLSQTGIYNLVSASEVTPAGPGLGWYGSGEINVPMIAGRYYLIYASFEQPTYYYNEQGIFPYPIPASFGELTGGAGWNWSPDTAFPPPISQNVPEWAIGGDVAYYQTIVTGVGTSWVGVFPEAGTVPVDSCMNVSVSMSALDVEADDLMANIVVASNDPELPEVVVPARLHVIGVTDIGVSDDALDFGEVLIGGRGEDSLVISNDGTDLLVVSGLVIDNGVFSADTSGFSLAVGESRTLSLAFMPGDSGPVTGTLKIDSNDPDEPTVTVDLAGRGLIPPEIAVIPDSLYANLYVGESEAHLLTIKNSGGSELLFEISEGENPASVTGLYVYPDGGRAGDIPDDALPRRIIDPRSRYSGKYESGGDPIDPADVRVANVMGGERRVLLVMSGGDVSEIRDALLLFPDISAVDVFDARLMTPSLAYLMNYHAVVLLNDYLFYDPAALGDVLADYVDGGGGVIMTLATFVSGWEIGGRFFAQGYSPFNVGVGPVNASTLGAFRIDHPIMAGVTSAWGDLLASMSLAPGADWVADWAGGMPFIATQGEKVAGVNIFAAGSGTWTGDIPLILHNAIFWTSGGDIPWISIDPASGTVPAGHMADISVIFNAGGVTGGDYRDSLFVESNDPAAPVVPVPLRFLVKGAPDIMVSTSILEYGIVYIGQERTETLAVVNIGTDSLFVSGLTTGNPVFSAGPIAFAVAAGDTFMLPVAFAPVDSGSSAGTLTIPSSDPDEPVVTVGLGGGGIYPPMIGVSPDSIVDDLRTGETAVHTITIDNKGASLLEWNIQWEVVHDDSLGLYTLTPPDPDAAGGEEETGSDPPSGPARTEPLSVPLRDLTGITVMYDRAHGQSSTYNWETVIADLASRGATVVINTDPFTPELLSGYDVVWSTDVNYSFSADEIASLAAWVRKGGGLLLEGDNTGTVPEYNSILDALYAGIEFSTVDGTDGSTGYIYPHEATQGVSSIYLAANIARISSVLSPAGHLVDDRTGVPNSAYSVAGTGRIVAMADEVFSDERMPYDDNQLFANRVFDWLASAIDWMAVTRTSGTVPPDDSAHVDVILDATSQNGGDFRALLTVESNDPVLPEVPVPLHLHVEGAPDIAVSDTLMIFGDVFVGGSASDTLEIWNTGSDLLTVGSVSIDNPAFSAAAAGFTVGIGESSRLPVVFAPGQPRAEEGTLTISSNDPDEPAVAVMLLGAGIEPPVIVVSPDSLADSLLSGQSAEHEMVIGNAGASALEWNIHVEITDDSSLRLYTLAVPEPDAEAEEEESGPPPGPVRQAAISAYLDDLTGVSVMFDRAHGQTTTIGWDVIIADLEARGATVFVNYDPFTLSLLSGFDIVWSIDIPYALTSSELSALDTWTRAGGGLLLEGDNTSAVPVFNGILGALGAGIEYSTVDGATGTTALIHPHETTRDVTAIYLSANIAHLSTVAGPAGRLVDDIYGDPNTAYSRVGCGRVVAMADEICSDYHIGYADNQLFANQVFGWLCGSAPWLDVSPASGTVEPGGGDTVSVLLDAVLIPGGDYHASIEVSCNDPVTPGVSIPVSMHVTGAADITLSDTLLYFGETYVGTTKWDTVYVSNSGSGTLLVVDVSIDEPAFSTSTPGFALDPGESRPLVVAFSPLVRGPVDGTLSILSNDADEPVVEVALTGVGNETQVWMVYPNGGEVFRIGEPETIRWVITGPALGYCNVYLSRDGGLTFDETLATGIGASNSFQWAVTGPETGSARVRIAGYRDGQVIDVCESSSDFSIRGNFVYVSPWGANQYPFATPENAANSIQDAIGAAEAGDTIAVAGAEYRNGVTLDSAVHLYGGWDSTFTARDPALFETVIKTSGSPVTFMNVDSSRCGLEGFTLMNGTGTSGTYPAPGLYGGGIFSFESSSIVKGNRIAGCGYAGAVGFSAGGAVYCYGGAIEIEDNEIAGCTAQTGGGIYLYGTDATVRNNRISGSSSHPEYVGFKYGGGIYAIHSAVALEGNSVFDNDGYQKGGGIYVKLCDVTAAGDTVRLNDVLDMGGGIYAEESSLDASHLVVLSNTAFSLAGGIYHKLAHLSLVNSIVALNESGIVGGGIYTEMSGGLVRNNTFDRNRGVFGGGNVFIGPTDSLAVNNNLVTYGKGYGFQANTLDNIEFHYNNCFGNWPGDISTIVPDTTNTSRNPHYADTTALDYHLLVHSGGIDAGDPMGWADRDTSRADQGAFGGPGAVMLAPAFVRDLTASTVNDTTILLEWEPLLATPLSYYAVYGDTAGGFAPDESNYVAAVPFGTNVFSHHPVSGCMHYRVSAVNAAGYGGGYSNQAGSCAAGTGGAVAGGDGPPLASALAQNYPNPFNPTTSIAFSIAEASHVSLRIYDAAGRLVRVLADGYRIAGRHREVWNGRDNRGGEVASGIYFYRLTAGTFSDTKKMVLLR